MNNALYLFSGIYGRTTYRWSMPLVPPAMPEGSFCIVIPLFENAPSRHWLSRRSEGSAQQNLHVVMEPGRMNNVRVTRRLTDSSTDLFITVNKSTVVTVE